MICFWVREEKLGVENKDTLDKKIQWQIFILGQLTLVCSLGHVMCSVRNSLKRENAWSTVEDQ